MALLIARQRDVGSTTATYSEISEKTGVATYFGISTDVEQGKEVHDKLRSWLNGGDLKNPKRSSIIKIKEGR